MGSSPIAGIENEIGKRKVPKISYDVSRLFVSEFWFDRLQHLTYNMLNKTTGAVSYTHLDVYKRQ